MAKNIIDDGFGSKAELKKVADMCRIKCIDYLGSNNDTVIIMFSSKQLDKFIKMLQDFRKNKLPNE